MADEKQETPDKNKSTTGAMNINNLSQSKLLPGVTGATPPRFLTWDEINAAANGITKMYLAHEVAVDDQFRLEKMKPPQNSIESRLKETLHNAFWDLLRENLSADPPNYDQALVLLDDIKQNLFDCLLAHHSRLKEEIEDVLDKEVIKQQVETNTLDFQFYATFVVNMISKLCAPIRDDTVKELRQETDVVTLFRKILELLDLMKLDIANFTLSVFKNDITLKSVEYEKSEFKKFLVLQTDNGVDGLEYTKLWLLRHYTETTPRSNWYKILGQCYVDLLDWKQDSEYPETVLMDRNRFTEIGVECHRIAIVASIVLIAIDKSNGALQVLPTVKQEIKTIALNAIKEKPLSELESSLPALAESVVHETTEVMKKTSVEPLNGEEQSILYHTILGIVDPNQRIRQLVYNRMKEFFLSVITMESKQPMRIPGGLGWMHAELMALSGQIMLLVKHNREVFWEFYSEIFANHDVQLKSLSQTEEAEDEANSAAPSTN